MLSDQALKQKDGVYACKVAKKLVDYHPNRPLSYILFAKALMLREKFVDAEKILLMGQQKTPNQINLLNTIVSIAWNSNSYPIHCFMRKN